LWSLIEDKIDDDDNGSQVNKIWKISVCVGLDVRRDRIMQGGMDIDCMNGFWMQEVKN